MSIVGSRSSSRSGWVWSVPSGAGRPPQIPPPILPFVGAVLLAMIVGITLLALWSSDSGDGGASAVGTPPSTPTFPASRSPTPEPTATPIATPTLSPSPTSVPTPSPTASGPSGQAPVFSLAGWDGDAWAFGHSLVGTGYREGEAIPFLLRIERALPGETYFVTLFYGCESFKLLTSYDRDRGEGPALAPGGPSNGVADSTLRIPTDPSVPADDGAGGSLSLWGGAFSGLTPIVPASPCIGDKSFTVGLTAFLDTLYLLWSAEIAPGAADSASPLRLAVQSQGVQDLSIEIDPAGLLVERP